MGIGSSALDSNHSDFDLKHRGFDDDLQPRNIGAMMLDDGYDEDDEDDGYDGDDGYEPSLTHGVKRLSLAEGGGGKRRRTGDPFEYSNEVAGDIVAHNMTLAHQEDDVPIEISVTVDDDAPVIMLVDGGDLIYAAIVAGLEKEGGNVVDVDEIRFGEEVVMEEDQFTFNEFSVEDGARFHVSRKRPPTPPQNRHLDFDDILDRVALNLDPASLNRLLRSSQRFAGDDRLTNLTGLTNNDA